MKINLSDIQGLVVTRGRKPYENAELLADIKSLDASDPNEAICWEEAEGDPSDEEYNLHKAKFRSRAEAVADTAGVEISTTWLTDGRMVIKLKPKKKASK
jgi:hypothetical protein